MHTLSSAFIVSALMVCGSSAHAATLFSENFDAENGGLSTVLNYDSFAQFAVSDGTVDLIANGGYGISCVGGTGVCVDLDGSTSNAGRLTSSSFVLAAAQDITLSFSLSGNQRGGSSDLVTFGFLFGATEIAESRTLAPFDPFGTVTFTLTGASAGSYSIFFENSGSDNIGAILDNVAVTTDGSVSVVPLPAAAPFLLVGLGALGFAARRRKS